LSGTVDDANLASVDVYDGGTLLGSATVDSGNWSFTTAPLADGHYSFAIEVTDAAGNMTYTSGVPATVDTSGDSTLEGDSGDNALAGGAGTDTVSYEHATAGVTVSLAVTSAQNTVGAGTDTLTGFENLTGSSFDDALTGSSSDNVLMGLAGNDVLVGGAGADVLTGGSGGDRFVFNEISDSSPDGADVITDFVHGTDTIDLSAIDANTSSSGDQAFTNLIQSMSVFDHGVSWFESNGNTIVQADVNGNTTADLTIVLTGTNLNLSTTDFRL
ncbi:MAG TPA: Ig-like domain-containing protein, partial [Mycobacterium sp.]|nr:Ig-like domain-containing protein [Mycobacterium sp.]